MVLILLLRLLAVVLRVLMKLLRALIKLLRVLMILSRVLMIQTAAVLEIDASESTATLVTEGCYPGTLRDAVAHPIKPQYVVCDDSGGIRIFDSAEHRLAQAVLMEIGVYCVEFSSDGRYLVAGMANGELRILAASKDFETAFVRRNRKRPILMVRFSPDTSLLAAATSECVIDLFSVNSLFEVIGCLQGHWSGVKNIQWSVDSKYLMSTSIGGEIRFWIIESQEELTARLQIVRGIPSRDLEWETWTSAEGWPSSGATQHGRRTVRVARSRSQALLATANTDGQFRLHRYPCFLDGAAFATLSAHGGSVVALAFTADDSRLVTLGSRDGAIMQWTIASAQAMVEEMDRQRKLAIAAKKKEAALRLKKELVEAKEKEEAIKKLGRPGGRKAQEVDLTAKAREEAAKKEREAEQAAKVDALRKKLEEDAVVYDSDVEALQDALVYRRRDEAAQVHPNARCCNVSDDVATCYGVATGYPNA